MAESTSATTTFAVQGAEVQFFGLTRDYGDLTVVRDVNVTVAPGEFVTLLGASGSGKTTTLMMVAGFVTPSAGDVKIGGQSVLTMPAHKRNLGIVFQNYALFPHMSVAENIGFPLRMRDMDKTDIEKRVQAALEMVHLEGLGDRRTNQISGGQQQRVALARALVFRPPVLLMDEPLGALDRKLREQMQAEIKQLQRNLGLTVIYVTHDQEEALVMSDRIAIMHNGEVLQIDSPSVVYERPATAYVADFLGESNFVDATVETAGAAESIVRLGSGTAITVRNNAFSASSKVRLMLRPEAIQLRATEAVPGAPTNQFTAVVEDCEYLGQSIRYRVRVDGVALLVRESRQPGGRQLANGDRVAIRFSAADVSLFGRD